MATNKPTKKFRAWSNGAWVEAAVFRHHNEERVNYSVNCTRSYVKENKENPEAEGEWENSPYFYAVDLPVLALLIQQAWAWINEQGR